MRPDPFYTHTAVGFDKRLRQNKKKRTKIAKTCFSYTSIAYTSTSSTWALQTYPRQNAHVREAAGGRRYHMYHSERGNIEAVYSIISTKNGPYMPARMSIRCWCSPWRATARGPGRGGGKSLGDDTFSGRWSLVLDSAVEHQAEL